MMDNIKDPGNKKWSMAMMLPEHVKLLSEWEDEKNKVGCPELEDWELELIGEEIKRAYKSKATIKLTYWRNGYLKDDYGKVISIDPKSKAVVLDNPFGTKWYPPSEIVAVTLID